MRFSERLQNIRAQSFPTEMNRIISILLEGQAGLIFRLSPDANTPLCRPADVAVTKAIVLRHITLGYYRYPQFRHPLPWLKLIPTGVRHAGNPRRQRARRIDAVTKCFTRIVRGCRPIATILCMYIANTSIRYLLDKSIRRLGAPLSFSCDIS